MINSKKITNISVNKLKMPIGESDFRCLIQGGYYFIDKSLFIKEVLDDSASVLLITRPRCFGKTLNLSMLRYFLTEEVDSEKTHRLFDGLKIQKEVDIVHQYQGRYPVIFLTFKDLNSDTFEKAYQNFCELIAILYGEHRYLLTGDLLAFYEKEEYQAILDAQASPAVIGYALKTLSEYLHRYHKVAPIILIDAYDTPIQAGDLNGYDSKVVGLLSHFLGAGLKDNPHCSKAVLTGISRVSKENLSSSLNNILVYSVLKQRYGEYFGFTESEVQALLEYTGLETHLSAIRSWYNGYQIGPYTIYNPWSLLSCVDEKGQLQRYWLNTSDSGLVKDCLYRSGLIHKEVFEQLLSGQAVSCLIDEYIVFPHLHSSYQSDAAILSFLLMAGYFTVRSIEDTGWKTSCQLAIPNIEIQDLYVDLIKDWLIEGQQKVGFNEFLGELLRGDIPAFEKSFRFLLENTVSVHELNQKPEAFYHGFMTGLTAHLQSHPDYELKSNRESGDGRYDYLILSRVPEKPTLLMEFKRVHFTDIEKPALEQVDAALEKAANEALEQMEAKAFDTGMKNHQLIKIVIAFCGKQFKPTYTS
jgi:hypothetical protein